MPSLGNVLFLCAGNICRSPVALVVFAREAPNFRCISRGTEAWNIGKPVDTTMESIANSHGYDLSAHRASMISREDVLWCDVIVSVDQRTSARVVEFFGADVKAKIMLLVADRDVSDPYGQEAVVYESVFAQILHAARQLPARALSFVGRC